MGPLPVLPGFVGFREGEAVFESEPGVLTAIRLDNGSTRELGRVPGPAKTADSSAGVQNGPETHIWAPTEAGFVAYVEESGPKPVGIPAREVPRSRLPGRHVAVPLADLKGARRIRRHGDVTVHLLTDGADAKPIIVARHLNGPNAVVAGDTVYWIERGEWAGVPPKWLPREEKGVPFIPDFPSCDRVLRAKVGTTQVEGCSAPPPMALAAVGSLGAAWIEPPQVSGSTLPTLLYWDVTSSSPTRLPGHRIEGWPVAWGDRLCWIERRDPALEIVPFKPVAFRLVSADRRLSAIRDESALTVHGALIPIAWPTWNANALFSHGSNVFALCSGDIVPDADGDPRTISSRQADASTSLYSLVHGGARGAGRVSKRLVFPLKANQYLRDGDSLVTFVTEEHEHWFDWSSKGLAPSRQQVAYRISLTD